MKRSLRRVPWRLLSFSLGVVIGGGVEAASSCLVEDHVLPALLWAMRR
jgi:hypothetical protein